VETLRWPSGVRVEAGIQEGDTVTPYYDPLVAKIITSGPTREEARGRMVRALAETEIGPLITNLGFLRTLIDGEPFRSGVYDTTTVESSLVRKP
jgi:acetyl/propionyl-CoA carboxylase alpha subunit